MVSIDPMEVAGFNVKIVRKAIKNLHVGVYPPDGHVRVAAPLAVSDDAIRIAVLTRLPWIKSKRHAFEKQPRQTERKFVSGETHYVFGRPCRLRVECWSGKKHQIEIQAADRLLLLAPETSDLNQRRAFIEKWQREELRQIAAPIIETWADRLHLELPAWGIKRMKTKWGSCNPDAGRIWINFELAKKPKICTDYIVLHELAHFISPRHDDAFIGVLDKMMPSWRQVRSDLNALPLSTM
jgi:predicted metal-dependent hydrolase